MSHDPFIASDLLVFAKTGVRNLGVAVTETATPAVRAALAAQTQRMTQLHGAIFAYMLARSQYPAYSTERTIQGDFRRAQAVLAMPPQQQR